MILFNPFFHVFLFFQKNFSIKSIPTPEYSYTTILEWIICQKKDKSFKHTQIKPFLISLKKIQGCKNVRKESNFIQRQVAISKETFTIKKFSLSKPSQDSMPSQKNHFK